MNYRVTLDFSPNLQQRLKALSGPNWRAGVTRGLQKAATVVQAEAQRRVTLGPPDNLLVGNGDLRRSIRTKSLGPLAVEIAPNIVYGAIHEFGGVIKPKNGRFLVFRVMKAMGYSISRQGKIYRGTSAKTRDVYSDLIFARQVTIPPRPYIGPALAAKIDEVRSIFEGEITAILEGRV